MINQEILKDELTYDPVTGIFTWNKSRPGVKAGSQAGCEDRRGYRMITVRWRNYMAHRLAWLYVYGSWPEPYVDHINRNKSDNRIANLRPADGSQNGNNRSIDRRNTSGYRGVSYCRARNLWCASICVRGETIQLGGYGDPAEAGRAVDEARTRYFGAFAGVLNSDLNRHADIGRKVLELTREGT